jgi:hypothetical protein
VGTIVPIMQFANSDIEDLKIVEEEPIIENPSTYSKPVLTSPPPRAQPAAPQKQSSIHDDPAIVSAVVSSTNKDLSMSNRLIHDLQHLNLSDEQSKKLPKTEGSRIRPDSGETGASWSVFSSQQQDPSSGNRSKFFDGFQMNNPQSKRWPSNTHSTQTSSSRQDDDSGLPVRQPFYSNDRPYPRSQNGNMQNQQRYNYNNRRPPQRRGGGNRETFHDGGNDYDDDFDFETSNRKFNKIVSEDEFKQQSDSPNQFLHSTNDSGQNQEYEPIYDKKKSFFDNITLEETQDVQAPMYNRSRNQDTFGYDRNQQQRNRGGGGGYRRTNNNYRQQGNENFYHRQNNNGYHYRY